MFTFHETIQLFEYNALGTSGYGPTERRALDDWLIQRIYEEDAFSPLHIKSSRDNPYDNYPSEG